MIVRHVRTALAAIALLCCWPAAQANAQEPAPRQILVLTALPPAHLHLGSAYAGGYGNDSARAGRLRLARQIARRNGLTLADDWPIPLAGLDCFVMSVPQGMTIEAAIHQVSTDRRVAFAEPMQLYSAKGAPALHGDPLLPAQPALPGWQLTALHRISTGRGVRVAVIDSAIDGTHPDLAGQLIANENMASPHPFVPERHGTAIAGVIAAKAGNGVGIAGVAPEARLLGLRACWERPPDTVCDTLSLAKALSYAVDHKARVINMSLAGPPGTLLDRLVTIALARRIDVVAAYDPGLPNGGFPASHPGVVAVADARVNRPAGIYAAQGRDVIATLPGGRWGLVSGSSFAAAHVSGLLALLFARRPTEDAAAILASARTASRQIDACAALLRGAVACECACSGGDHALAGR